MRIRPKREPRGLKKLPPEIARRYPQVRFVTRGPAAHILGITVTELRRREKRASYPFVLDDAGRAWYDEQALRRIAGDERDAAIRRNSGELPLRSAPKPLTQRVFSAALASQVFEALRKGKSPVDIVVEMQVHPEDVIAIQEVHARVTGGLYLTPAHLDQLAHLPLRAWPPKTPEQFVLSLRASMELDLKRCAKCGRAHARLCGACAGRLGSRGAAPSGTAAPATERVTTHVHDGNERVPRSA